MAKDYQNVRMYGDLTSGVFVAPKGTTLPTDLATAPAAAFLELGWLAEDGVAEAISADTVEFHGWQGSTLLKRKRTKAGKTFTFQCLEENAATMGLKYRGQVPTVTGAAGAKVAKLEYKNQNVTDERAWVIDAHDGLVKHRHVIPAGAYEVTGTVEYQAANMTILTVEVSVIGEGAYELTNNPAVTGDTTVTSY